MENKRRKAPEASRSKAQDDVIYTQPKPFHRNRFFLYLATVLAVVLAVLFSLSLFFKVETVEVTGVERYSTNDIYDAAGIQNGENLLVLSKARISGNIIAKLPYVKSVQVAIRLPGTVIISIEELEVTYAVEDGTGAWWLMDVDGRIVESVSTADAQDHLRVLGVQIADAQVGKQAIALEQEAQTEEDGEIIPVAVTGADRLNAALSILSALEKWHVLGQVPTVDVTDITNLQLWYANRFQVRLGTQDNMSFKIDAMKQAVEKMGSYEKGELDVSFTLFPTEVVYTPAS